MTILEEALQPRRLSLEEAYSRIKKLGLRNSIESVEIIRRDRDAR